MVRNLGSRLAGRDRATAQPTVHDMVGGHQITEQRSSHARQAIVIDNMDADTFFGSLASKVAALTDTDRPHPISVATAIAELKHLLPDPTQGIRVHDLVCGEALRLRSACNDTTRFPLHLPSNHRSFDQELMQSRVKAYEGQTELLEGLFAVGCAWDTNPLPFAEALKITADISHMADGNEDLLHLRRYPALRCLYAGGIAAVYQQRWDMLWTLTLDATTTYRHYGPLPMATALDYWSMFRGLRTARFLPGQARHDIPVSHYLFETLREVLRGAVPVDHEYETAFDRFEYMLGLIIEDTRSQQPEGVRTGDAPVGYFIRYGYSTHTPPVWERIKSEAEQAGADWGPIRAGIFGGSIERFAAAEEKHRNHVLKAW